MTICKQQRPWDSPQEVGLFGCESALTQASHSPARGSQLHRTAHNGPRSPRELQNLGTSQEESAWQAFSSIIWDYLAFPKSSPIEVTKPVTFGHGMCHIRQDTGVRWASSFSVCKEKRAYIWQIKRTGKLSTCLGWEGKRDLCLETRRIKGVAQEGVSHPVAAQAKGSVL